MAYVAVSGGEDAIAASLELLRDELYALPCSVSLDTLAAAVPELIDQVMGEGSLYAPRLAALALRQSGGSVEEAVFLLRAFRSTLERSYQTRVVDTVDMCVSRRVSAAFKDIPGGQLLGLTRDYSHRLLDFTLDVEAGAAGAGVGAAGAGAGAGAAADDAAGAAADGGSVSAAEGVARNAPTTAVPHDLVRRAGFSGLPRVSAYLVEQGLMAPPVPNDTAPSDITMEPLSFPAPRSARLQTLARGMTQAVLALGYAAIRGFGPAHPTVGELRQGTVEILVDHPLAGGEVPDACYLGSIPVTEVESLFEVEDTARDTRDARGTRSAQDTRGTRSAREVPEPARESPETHGAAGATSMLAFDIGYGLVLGRCESKAIAMSVLDHCLEREGEGFPTEDEEFVLTHIDGIEATGFVSHLKLPHYVTFQSKLDSVRTTRAPQDPTLEPDDMIEGDAIRGTDV
jgi:alpha-D-ribose 1-methylphosphonate 5-triphosphate synthase subunit PhnI